MNVNIADITTLAVASLASGALGLAVGLRWGFRNGWDEAFIMARRLFQNQPVPRSIRNQGNGP